VALIFALGVALMLVAPLLRWYHKASSALAGGAFIMLGLTGFGLIHPDARIGQAAIEPSPPVSGMKSPLRLPCLCKLIALA